MNNRTSILSILVVLGGIAALLSTTAQSQFGAPKNYVTLQPTSPGTSQSGHSNISGTAVAGQFAGGGTGLTGLNASNISSGTLANGRTTGTSANAASTLVLRDGSGGFAAGTVTGTFSGTLIGSGTGIIGINAANISSGTLADARLSANVALLNSVQTFAAAKTFSIAPSFSAAGAPFSVSSTSLITSLNADLLDGLSSSAFLQAIPVPLTLASSTSGSHTIKGSNSATSTASVGVVGESTSASGITYGIYGRNTSTSGLGVYGYAVSGTGVTYGVYGQCDSTSGYAMYANNTAISGTTYGLYAISNSPSGRGVYAIGGTEGVYGISTAGTGVRAQTTSGGTALYGERTANGNRGWFGGTNEGGWGQSTTGDGLVGKSSAANRSGVYGENNAAGNAYGVAGNASGASGVNYGVHGNVQTSSGYAVYGLNNGSGRYGYLGGQEFGAFGANQTGTNQTYGFLGSSEWGGYGEHGGSHFFGYLGSVGEGTYGFGLYGAYGLGDNGGQGVRGRVQGSNNLGYLASASYGVYGSNATNGSGVHGESVSGAGISGTSTNNDALFARTFLSGKSSIFGYTDTSGANGGYFNSANGAGAGNGVVGQTNSGGFGVRSVGDFSATGGKFFQIDHPLDPENKFLNHAAIEAPEPLNMYRGNAILDHKGEAWVTLPDYFEEINKEFHYQLTCIGGFAQVYVAEEIKGNQFKIAGGKQGLKVSWTVTGERNDLYMRNRKRPTEELKPQQWRGKYLHPEFYNLPPEYGIYNRKPHQFKAETMNDEPQRNPKKRGNTHK